MIPIVAASIPPYPLTLLKTAAAVRSSRLPTFAQTGVSTQNATIELIVWVCGFLIVVVVASPFIHKYVKKLRECEEPVDKVAMLADFRAAYRAGQMDEAEFRRISDLIQNPPAHPAPVKAVSPPSTIAKAGDDQNPLDPSPPVAIEPAPRTTHTANVSDTTATVPPDADSTPAVSIDSNSREHRGTPSDPSQTNPDPGATLIDSEATQDA